jgi:7,8-dihydroneopterin aldolase/epimerase/oxygenase
MITIHLDKLSFYSFHGIYPEEKLLGNNYEVNITLKLDTGDRIETMEDTLDYSLVYELVRKKMNTPCPLLETLALEMANDIFRLDERIKSLIVNIRKKNPPLNSREGEVGVTCYKDR